MTMNLFNTIKNMISNLMLVIVMVFSYSCHQETDDPDPNFHPVVSAILSRPAASSVTINLLMDASCEAYWEYGRVTGTYPAVSETYTTIKDTPVETELNNLAADAKYYYRLRYRESGSTGSFLAGAEYTFQTCRPAGSTFKFAIEADPHLDNNSDTGAFALTLRNIAAADPDFMFDLGDTFMSEKQTPPVTQSIVTARHLLLRSYFTRICHSIPLYLVLGNHEGELGWRNDGSLQGVPAMSTLTRKLYYSNPVPDSFYSGNTTSEPDFGLRQNYYAWQWGDALFVVIDPFWYSMIKTGWGFSLGKAQYDWFKAVISGSSAKYKFVFAHNLVGGNGDDMRGGSEYAHLFEMGGYNLDGTYGFDTNRPGWGKPIHTIMKENNVTVFFHGHDHFYGKQIKDGIIYQEVPQPSNRNLTNISASAYGYTDGLLLPGRGYVLVTVSGTEVKVEYVGTLLPSEENSSKKNGYIIDSYTLR
ncbi:MAG TPA: metallophosphoesterase [Bacteroidales bacterium]|nr:metallophosphoesterase [Bacteroidales bacterium]